VALAEALSAELPLVIVLEDLHFASADERTVVAALAAAARHRSLLVVASSRAPAPTILPEHGARIVMNRLPPEATQQLVRDALGPDVAVEVVSSVVARSGGNPFYALALSRGAAAQGAAGQAPSKLPAGIRRMIAASLARFAAEEREILDVSACYGQRIDARVVARVLGASVAHVVRRLAAITEEGGVLRRHGATFVFDHHLVLESLLLGIPARRRRAHHAELAAALESTLPASFPGETAVALCGLYLDGGRGSDALRHAERALDTLAGSGAHAAAAGLCQRLLEVPGLLDGASRFEHLLRASSHLLALGRDADVRRLLDEALRNANERGDSAARARVLIRSARRALATGANEEALTVLAGAGAGQDPEADLIVGEALYGLGRWDEAQAWFDRAIDQGRSRGDVRLEARATIARSASLGSRALHDEAMRGYEAALRLCREAQDEEGKGSALHALAHGSYSGGDLSRAEALAREVLDLRRRLGERRSQGRAHALLGRCLLRRGDVAAARRELERAHSLAEETGDMDGRSTAASDLGHLSSQEGRLADALAWHERSSALAEAMRSVQRQAIGVYAIGCVYGDLGMGARARARLEECLGVARRHGIRFGEAYALLALAEAHAMESTDDAVLRRFEEALATRQGAGAAGEFPLAVGRIHLRRGDPARARPYFEQALEQASGDVTVEVLAHGHMALLPGVDPRPSCGRVLRLLPQVSMRGAMHGRFLLWRATGEIGHLAESYRLLLRLREHAPRDARESMIARVPLHAAIATAWRSGGPPSGPHPYG
jgi:tetratricopeptide (TPR) repeat protein